jgi:glycosyltransferase involved in cell wall biosynthesis
LVIVSSDNKFRVLTLCGGLDASIGGPVEAVVGINLGYFDLGHQAIMISIGTQDSSAPARTVLKRGGVPVIYIPTNRHAAQYQLSVRSFIVVLQEVRKADVVVCHGFYSFNLLWAVWSRRLHGTPMLLMPHGSLEPYQERVHRFRKMGFKMLYRFTKGVDGVAVASAAEARGIAEHRWIHCPVYVVGLGINVVEESVKETFRIDSLGKEIEVLAIGRIAHKKRLDLCIGAIGVLRDRGIKARLKIAGVGDPKLLAQLTSLVARLKLEEEVEFLGQVVGDAKWQLIRRSHVVVLPSENENFAIAIAEAFSMGTPVVVSKNVALSEVVSQFDCGVVISDLNPSAVATAIEVVQRQRDQMSTAALKAAQSLSWPVVMLQWGEMFAVASRRALLQRTDRL